MFTVVQYVPIYNLFVIFLAIVSESRLMAILLWTWELSARKNRNKPEWFSTTTGLGCKEPRNCYNVSDEFIQTNILIPLCVYKF